MPKLIAISASTIGHTSVLTGEVDFNHRAVSPRLVTSRLAGAGLQ